MKKVFGALIFCTFFNSYGSEKTAEPIKVSQSPKPGFINIKLTPDNGTEKPNRSISPFSGFSPRDGGKKSTKK